MLINEITLFQQCCLLLVFIRWYDPVITQQHLLYRKGWQWLVILSLHYFIIWWEVVEPSAVHCCNFVIVLSTSTAKHCSGNTCTLTRFLPVSTFSILGSENKTKVGLDDQAMCTNISVTLSCHCLQVIIIQFGFFSQNNGYILLSSPL